jgi:23S rRNA (uracil1939-C5)-methyltransferase
VSHASFFQVNRYLVPKMVELLSGESGSLLLDLYAGVGLFSAALAEKFVKVIAIESGEEAARDLAVNLAAAGGKATATRAEVEEWLPSVPQSGSGLKPDLVIVDPPRTGLARRVSEALSRIRPPRMVYFSCDPSTLARDLGILSSAGFRLQELHLLDLFPQTYHIEALAKLSLPV